MVAGLRVLQKFFKSRVPGEGLGRDVRFDWSPSPRTINDSDGDLEL